MTELERLKLVAATAKRLGFVAGFVVGAALPIIGSVFVIARWFARCR